LIALESAVYFPSVQFHLLTVFLLLGAKNSLL
jgi:hypothetical protein